ncbi:TRAP transporter substrate-binding protein [Tetragenococcus halophilus]|uniref:TRAP transporter substrate-binding protein n=1 Tax=Tetragenococcus halophilus TaxID=51669 RepID=UPI0015B9EB35|nr:TRAP transporter substrate-binding protein [Tetragenococcus halophilus]NWO00510.1 TRAP transporter substrate-binding protein [Tetragenococcus halophilus]
MKKRNLIFILLFICFSGVLVGCSRNNANVAEADETMVLRYAYADNSQPVIDSMNEFGSLVEEKTDGEVVIEYFPDGQLGGEGELIELTQTGGIDFTKVNAAALESFSETYQIFNVPYLFDSEQHFFNVMENEDIMNEIYQSTADLGFVGLTYYDSGQRSFYMKDGPVETLDDLKGKKIRTMESETATKMMNLLGASAVPMGSDEVFTSLQSNLIDGSENNEFVLYTAGHGEVAKYYSYDEHTRVPDIVIMNDSLKERLTDKQYEAVIEAAEESTQFEKEVFKEAVEEEKEIAAEEHNVQFNEVDNSEFREAVQPLHDQFQNDEDTSEIYNKIRLMGEE